MGFTTDEDEPADHRVKALIDELRRVKVGKEHAASLQQILGGRKADAGTTLDAIRGLFAALGENPIPEREWQSLLNFFDAQQLAILLRISESSVKRYAHQVRHTPDHIATRLHWLAIVVGYLTGTYNDYGVRRWFQRPRQALEGRSPQEALQDDGDWTPDGEAARKIEALAIANIGMTVT